MKQSWRVVGFVSMVRVTHARNLVNRRSAVNEAGLGCLLQKLKTFRDLLPENGCAAMPMISLIPVAAMATPFDLRTTTVDGACRARRGSGHHVGTGNISA